MPLALLGFYEYEQGLIRTVLGTAYPPLLSTASNHVMVMGVILIVVPFLSASLGQLSSPAQDFTIRESLGFARPQYPAPCCATGLSTACPKALGASVICNPGKVGILECLGCEPHRAHPVNNP
jgi:hypothetical protein